MRALGYDVIGGAGGLRPMDVPVPVPGTGEVLVRVAYAAVRAGGPAGGPAGRCPVPGNEVSGEVTAVGPGVTGVAAGDAVAAYLPDGGGYAEYAVARADFAFPLDGVSLRDGGGAVALTTAYGLLAAAARLAAGDTVLIHAAASPVGTAAAQIARALGAAAVHGALLSEDAEEAAIAKRFGYDGLHPAAAAAGAVPDVDVVLDPLGCAPLPAALAALAPFGRVVAAGAVAGAAGAAVPVRDVCAGNVAVVGYDLAGLARRVPGTVRSHALSALSLLAAGAVRIDVTTELPLPSAESAPPHGTTLLRLP